MMLITMIKITVKIKIMKHNSIIDISGPYFPAFRLNTERYFLRSEILWNQTLLTITITKT